MATGLFLWTSAQATFADDNGFYRSWTCGENGGPGCDVSARSTETQPGGSGPPPQAEDSSTGGSATSGGGGGSQGEDDSDCGDALELVRVPTNSGRPQSRLEYEATGCSVLEAGQAPGADEPVVDPVTVAHAARASMELPAPQMGGSPALEAEQLVGVPTWLWIQGQAWEPVSAEASVPGGWVEVTAAPTTAVWELGEDARVECAGPGTAYDPAVHAPEEASPDCGHTFTRSSADAPGGAFSVEVAVTWDVQWSSSEGDGGELEPLTTRAQEQVEVTESHGVVTR